MDTTSTSFYRPLKDDEATFEMQRNRRGDYARIVLGGIRLFNGATALFFPQVLARRLGVDTTRNPAILYVFRLFGVRTVIIGAALLSPVPATVAEALRTAVIIHASDTLAAVWAGLQRQLPWRSAITVTLISTINTVLAILAQPTRPCNGSQRSRKV
ncbi:MAG TPA: hypothetical protein VFB60_10655 [Ktedonobacteraceae bacterium]|nr:hypothetical protein [Ktedonobacteraceae bacterium]